MSPISADAATIEAEEQESSEEESPPQMAQPIRPRKNQQERARVAFEHEKTIKDHCLHMRSDFLALGKLLHEAYERGDWRHLGHKHWKDYIAQPEVDIKPTTDKALRTIHRKLVIEMGMPPDKIASLSYNKLMVIMPAVARLEDEAKVALTKVGSEDEIIAAPLELWPEDQKDQMDRVLSDAETQSYRDLISTYRNASGGPTSDEIDDRLKDADKTTMVLNIDKVPTGQDSAPLIRVAGRFIDSKGNTSNLPPRLVNNVILQFDEHNTLAVDGDTDIPSLAKQVRKAIDG